MKYIRKISNLIMFLGVMVILGTAGSCDLGEMTVQQSISMILLGFSVITFGRTLKEISKLKIRRMRSVKTSCIKFVPRGGNERLEYKKAG